MARSKSFLVALLGLCLLATACDEPKEVQIPLGDEQLAGLYWEPPQRLSAALLLLPMLGHDKEDWIPLATELRKQGYGVLALDLREKGRTDRDRLVADVRAGFTFLREQKKVDAARIGVIGASIGANAALNFAAEEPMARLTVLLSPGLNYRGVTTQPALRNYGARPLMLMAAEEDLSSAGAVRTLAEAAQSEAVHKLYPGSAHGTDLLQTGLPVAQEIIAFLRAHL
jgi:dienelactone hydrolase